MKKYPFLEKIGEADEDLIEEVLRYTDSVSDNRRITMIKTNKIIKFAAIAACAAVVIGVGAAALSRRGLPSTVPDAEVTEPAPVTEQTATTEQSDDSSTVEVERSYNERIADGEDVRIETYINQRIEHQGFAFTLKDITVSPTFPEGITKDDITHTPPVKAYTDVDSGEFPEGFIEEGYDYSEYAAEHGLPPIETEEAYGDPEKGEGAYTQRVLNVKDVIADNGLYQGPMDVPDEAYKWVFLELEIENLTGEEQLEYMADMELCGGVYLDHPLIHFIDERGLENEYYSDFQGYPYFGNTVCYMSEHTDKKVREAQTESVAFHNLDFAPGEKKSLIFGYCISDHFIYGDLVLTLHNSEPIFSMDDYVYLPLK